MSATVSKFHALLKGNSLDKLKAAIKTTQKESFEDVGFWRPTVDKAGNGSAVIRFLPSLKEDGTEEAAPFCSYYRHAFKGPNGWYIELCRTSIAKDEADPCVEYTSRLFKTGDEGLKKQGSAQARRLTYVANVLVLSDKAAPQNEGKVFLFRFGKKIMEKIEKCAADPEVEGDVPFDPFHVIEGANFRLRQKKQQSFPNYDDSTFEAPKPLYKGDEAAIAAVLEQCKPVSELVALDKFKPYDVLKKRLDKTMGFDTAQFLTPEEAAGETRTPRRAKTTELPGEPDEDVPVSTKRWTPPTVDDDDEVDDTDARINKFADDDE